MKPDFDVMVLAAHPDDAEICCGGTILGLLATGRRVAIVDLTEGEMSSRGTVETRRQECAAATEMLGVQERVNLRLPDAGLRDDDRCLEPVVAVIRKLRPRLLLAQHPHDIHPDHVVAGVLARRAYFHSGLTNYGKQFGAAFRPSELVAFPANDHVEPSFCVNISSQVSDKQAVIECYRSQVEAGDGSHFARKLDPLTRVQARDRYFGARIGVQAAEPFILGGPLALPGLDSLLD